MRTFGVLLNQSRRSYSRRRKTVPRAVPFSASIAEAAGVDAVAFQVLDHSLPDGSPIGEPERFVAHPGVSKCATQ